MRKDLSFTCDSDRSCNALLGGEPLNGRVGEGILVGRLHNAGFEIQAICPKIDLVEIYGQGSDRVVGNDDSYD